MRALDEEVRKSAPAIMFKRLVATVRRERDSALPLPDHIFCVVCLVCSLYRHEAKISVLKKCKLLI